jgi:hypothetical protein
MPALDRHRLHTTTATCRQSTGVASAIAGNTLRHPTQNPEYALKKQLK